MKIFFSTIILFCVMITSLQSMPEEESVIKFYQKLTNLIKLKKSKKVSHHVTYLIAQNSVERVTNILSHTVAHNESILNQLVRYGHFPVLYKVLDFFINNNKKDILHKLICQRKSPFLNMIKQSKKAIIQLKNCFNLKSQKEIEQLQQALAQETKDNETALIRTIRQASKTPKMRTECVKELLSKSIYPNNSQGIQALKNILDHQNSHQKTALDYAKYLMKENPDDYLHILTIINNAMDRVANYYLNRNLPDTLPLPAALTNLDQERVDKTTEELPISIKASVFKEELNDNREEFFLDIEFDLKETVLEEFNF